MTVSPLLLLLLSTWMSFDVNEGVGLCCEAGGGGHARQAVMRLPELQSGEQNEPCAPPLHSHLREQIAFSSHRCGWERGVWRGQRSASRKRFTIRLRGGASQDNILANAQQQEQRRVGKDGGLQPEMESELSSDIRELLEDPQKLDLAYNLTVDQFHKERDEAGGHLSDEAMEHYFWSHMLLRHPEIQQHDYTKAHWTEFLESFFCLDGHANKEMLDNLEQLWTEEQARGAVPDIESATMQDLMYMSSQAMARARRPLLHVPTDYLWLDEGLRELADGGTLLLAPGDLVPSEAHPPRGLQGDEQDEDDKEERSDEEGWSYVVEQARRALLIRGSFVQRSASSHQQATQEHEGDEQEKRDQQHKLEVKEVKLVDECLTRAWGRWELACASSGQFQQLRLLLQPPDPKEMTSRHTHRALVSVAGDWLFERCELRCSLSVVMSAVVNATLTITRCEVGGLGHARGTDISKKYGEVEEMCGRCEAMSRRALSLQQDADEWLKHAMWDKELEHKLSQLQDPNFLLTTPMADLDEAEALYNASGSKMAQEVGMLDSLTDPGNAEQWELFEAEVSKSESPVWIQVASRCEDALLMFDRSTLTMQETNVTLVEVVCGSALRVGDAASARVGSTTFDDLGFGVTVQGGGSVELESVAMSNCWRHPLQAIEPCEQTSISMSNCRVRCFGAEGALWSAGVRAGRCGIEGRGNVFEDAPLDAMAQMLRGHMPDLDGVDKEEAEMEAEHKRNLEARLKTIDVNQDLQTTVSSAPPGRSILFANDDSAAPF